ncbi:MAG TPA: ATP-grasp domain-containing protein [Candidatus Polarisedimenticolia bacterium]|jgi:biotin carboxylase|nr:ATP-grasp domain-containing protein [Candidatus Polarisedimenticolia bacterium]
MSETPRVLLLLPTHTYKAADFLEAAARLGVEAVVGSERRQALEGVAPAGGTLTLTLEDPAVAAAEIAAFARQRPLLAVVPTDDRTAVVAAVGAARLGLRHNPPEAARAARRKDLLRERLLAAGVRTPAHRVVTIRPSPSDAALAAEATGQRYPCVLKPLALQASRGVIRADDPPRFAAAFRRIEALLRRSDVMGRASEEERAGILIEPFVPGIEVALEGILSDGRLRTLAVFDKPDPLDGPFFEETIYVTPSRLARADQSAVIAAVAAGAEALGLVEGPVHAELRLARGQKPWVIELAARSIGGLCARVLRFGVGVSLEEVILTHALGRGIDDFGREGRAAGVMMLPIPRGGTLRAVDGLDEARAVPGIEAVDVTATLGQPVEALPEGGSYLGFAFARGDTPAEVEAALRKAHALLHVTIE